MIKKYYSFKQFINSWFIRELFKTYTPYSHFPHLKLISSNKKNWIKFHIKKENCLLRISM